MREKILFGLMSMALSVNVYAQGGTRSPYSQYGLGVLSERSQGFSRGMNGAGIALRQGNIVNTLNPASFSAIDSLTMIFDLGIAGQITRFNETTASGIELSASQRNASFEYAVGSFRLFRNVGMSFGILPYSNVKYSYSATNALGVSETNSGSGGLREVFVGVGWRVIPQLSIGANIGYLWGSFERAVISGSTSYINSLGRSYEMSASSYKIDLGVQWQQPINRDHELTFGATLGIGHNLNADSEYEMANLTKGTITPYTVEDAYSIPMTYGVGVAWRFKNKLLADADFSIQQWGRLDYPAINASGDYVMQSGLLKNSYHFKMGADYVPDALDRRYLKRVHYRMGVGYSTPYYIINGKDGPKEISASVGFGLPLQNSYNNRSVLNVSAQWVRTNATGMITENTFRINLGLTFNERWFAKWKIE